MSNWFLYKNGSLSILSNQIQQDCDSQNLRVAQLKISNLTNGKIIAQSFPLDADLRQQDCSIFQEHGFGIYEITLKVGMMSRKCMFVYPPNGAADFYQIKVSLKQNAEEHRLKMKIEANFRAQRDGVLPADTLYYEINDCPIPMMLSKLNHSEPKYYVMQSPKDGSLPTFHLATIPVPNDAEVFPPGTRTFSQECAIKLSVTQDRPKEGEK